MTELLKEKINKHLERNVFRIVGEVADSMNRECYVVGGYVRDIILERTSKDIDFVTIGSGIEVAEMVAKTMGKRTSLAVYRTYGTAQVKNADYELEFVGARRESYNRESRNPIVEDGTLEEDQCRRDFTINAMAICVNKDNYGKLLDPFDGLGDLERRIIRTPLDPDVTFSDDPLRMMRAVRFATQLGFDIYPETFDALVRNKERIKIITRERIVDELMKIMKSAKPSRGFRLLKDCGLLEFIMPELNALSGVEVMNGRGHKDNFEHTLQVLDNVADKSDYVWLRWGALMHDIAKPITKMKYVQKLVELHMRPIALVEETVTDSAVRRLIFDAGDYIEDLMLLCEADITSKNQEKVKRFLDNFQLVREKMKEIEEKDRIRNFQPPIDGLEIMRVFGLEPCSEVGQLKEKIKNAILDGEIGNNHEEAFEYMLIRAAEMGLAPLENKQ